MEGGEAGNTDWLPLVSEFDIIYEWYKYNNFVFEVYGYYTLKVGQKNYKWNFNSITEVINSQFFFKNQHYIWSLTKVIIIIWIHI